MDVALWDPLIRSAIIRCGAEGPHAPELAEFTCERPATIRLNEAVGTFASLLR